MLSELFHKVQQQRIKQRQSACRDWREHTEADSILLEFLLPRLIQQFGSAFCRFADCGAHLGLTTLLYEQMLTEHLPKERSYHASVYAYEPMPENFAVLQQATLNKPAVIIRPVAVADYNNQAQFVIPSRWNSGPVVTTGNALCRCNGCSTEGHLLDPLIHQETKHDSVITVKVVRLENESESGFDFVKMDLQGGERAALKGMGKHLTNTKLIYTEHQFLRPPDKQPLTLLQDSGFKCFIDSLQFRFHEHIATIPADLLREGGIAIDCVEVINDGEISPRFQGHMENGTSSLLQENGTFPDDYAQALKESGIHYLQTDIVAINPSIMSDVMAMTGKFSC